MNSKVTDNGKLVFNRLSQCLYGIRRKESLLAVWICTEPCWGESLISAPISTVTFPLFQEHTHGQTAELCYVNAPGSQSQPSLTAPAHPASLPLLVSAALFA